MKNITTAMNKKRTLCALVLCGAGLGLGSNAAAQMLHAQPPITVGTEQTSQAASPDTARTEPTMYMGVGLGQGQTTLKPDLTSIGLNGTFKHKGGTVDLRVGRYFSPNFAAEARVGASFGIDKPKTTTMTNPTARADSAVLVNDYLALYAVGKAPLGGGFTPYAMAGLGVAKLNYAVSATLGTKRSDISRSRYEAGPAFGAGIDFDLNEATTLGLEYSRVLHKKEVKVDNVGLAVKFKFY